MDETRAAVVAATQASADTEAAVLQSARVGDAAAALALGISEETGKRTEGQRSTSWMWETTQMKLALKVIGGFMAAHFLVVLSIAIILVVYWKTISKEPIGLAVLVAILTGALGAIASMASLVIGFYFSRTNHSRIGGVGGDEVRGVR